MCCGQERHKTYTTHMGNVHCGHGVWEEETERQMKLHTNGKTRWFVICSLQPISTSAMRTGHRFWKPKFRYRLNSVHTVSEYSCALYVESFKYLGKTRTNQKRVYKGMNSVLHVNSANAWYYSIQSLLISRLPQIRSRLKYTELCFVPI